MHLAAPTYSVSALCAEIQAFVAEAFNSVWVVGEVQRVRLSSRGHLYLELIEKGRGDQIVGRLEAVIWRGDYQRVRLQLERSGQQLRDGLEIRCRGNLDFWAPGGRLQLVVREVDPIFTLGLLEQRRRETLEALRRAGLLERNKALELPVVPLTVGLVTSQGSAAYHDFLSSLAQSGYGFQVLFVHTSVQGASAEAEIVRALEWLRRAAAGTPGGSLDCVAIVRGGGARTDLAAFDSRAVAEALARAPFPVLTGLGHETDQSIADQVAHSAFKTPTMVAEFLVEQVAEADLTVSQLQRRILREAREPLLRGRHRVEKAERGLRVAAGRLTAASGRLEQLARLLGRLSQHRLQHARGYQEGLRRRLVVAVPRLLARRRQRPREVAERITAQARAHLSRAQATVEGLARLTAQLAPERTLERGFSLTYSAAGQLLRRADQAAPGDRIRTRLAAGELQSVVGESVVGERVVDERAAGELEVTE